MTAVPADLALDALLAELRPPPMSAGLADRVAAAALALPQGGRAARAVPRHARRWLRRPLLVGAAALGLAFTGAVAATLAGVELPRPVAAVLEKLPLVGKAAPELSAPPPPARRVSDRPAPPPQPPKQVGAEPSPPPLPALPPRLERRIERLERTREIVAARRAAGLPTPRADRMDARRERIREIVAARRAAGLPTPRADRMEARQQQVQQLLEARRQQRAADPTPLPPPAPAIQRPEAPVTPSDAQPAPSSPSAERPSLLEQRERLRRQQLTRPDRLEWLRRVQQRRELIRRMQERRATMDRIRPR